MGTIILNAIKAVLNYLIELLGSLVSPLFDSVLGLFPSLNFDSSSFTHLLCMANSWVALDYAFGLMFAYISIISSIILIKWVLAFIPTMG